MRVVSEEDLARILFEEHRAEHLAAAAVFPEVMAGRSCPPWEEQPEEVRDFYRRRARGAIFPAGQF